ARGHGLLNRTAYTVQYIARARADQSDGAHRDRENDSEHRCVLCDILAFFLAPSIATKASHFLPQYELLGTRALEHSDCPIHGHGTMAHPCLKPTGVTNSLMTKVTND
ncbi:MAG: hypothetical protein WA637_14425, partial [Terriglobales bacterium]